MNYQDHIAYLKREHKRAGLEITEEQLISCLDEFGNVINYYEENRFESAQLRKDRKAEYKSINEWLTESVRSEKVLTETLDNGYRKRMIKASAQLREDIRRDREAETRRKHLLQAYNFDIKYAAA